MSFLKVWCKYEVICFRQAWSEQGVGHIGTNQSGARLPTDAKSTTFWLLLVNPTVKQVYLYFSRAIFSQVKQPLMRLLAVWKIFLVSFPWTGYSSWMSQFTCPQWRRCQVILLLKSAAFLSDKSIKRSINLHDLLISWHTFDTLYISYFLVIVVCM